jgi:hypothetical protein
VLRHWHERSLAELLASHGLGDVPEEPFPSNGWSGSRLTSLRRPTDGRRFILKRTAWAIDWIARSTRDHALREGFIASTPLPLPEPLVAPYLGAAGEGTSVGILMPDLSAELLPWDGAPGEPPLGPASLDRILDAVARLHAMPWPIATEPDSMIVWPSVPWRERLLLLSPTSAAELASEGVAAGARFTAGWQAFRRVAPPAAVALVERLDRDPSPLLGALQPLPWTGLHGDLKLANVAFLGERGVALIDWQMTALAPVAVELGWLLVVNAASLPEPPDATMARYKAAVEAIAGHPFVMSPPYDPAVVYPSSAVRATAGLDPTPHYRSSDEIVGSWEAQLDLVWIIGLLLRGWRKGLDTEAGATLGSGESADDDLAWWCARATEAAARRF